MLFGCLLFPVIQPIAIYLKAKGQVRAMPKGVELAFDEKRTSCDDGHTA